MTNSQSANELIRSRAKENGLRRTEEVIHKVRGAMETISGELLVADGVYPNNKGRLTLSELARRAGVHKTTLHHDRYKDLLAEARAWLEKPKEEASTQQQPHRRSTRERLDEYRALFEGLRQAHYDSNLELLQTKAELEDALERVKELKEENEKLNVLVREASGSRIVKLPSKSSRCSEQEC